MLVGVRVIVLDGGMVFRDEAGILFTSPLTQSVCSERGGVHI